MACGNCNCGKKELEESGCLPQQTVKLAHPVIVGIALGGLIALIAMWVLK